MRRRGLPRLAAGAAALLLATAAAAAEPARVALVRPARPDPIAVETLTRLQAELVAAGFTVVVLGAGPERDPRAWIEGEGAAGRQAAVVRLVDDGHGRAEVWLADPATHATEAHAVEAGATAESSRPAALAIRAVELLRAGLLDGSGARGGPGGRRAASPRERRAEALLDDSADLADTAPPARRRRARRALLEGPTAGLGLAAIYGLGDTTGRLTPVLRVGYGAAMGLAGRLTVLGTSTDQAALVEAAYGFGRGWWSVAPVVSLGAGGCHTHLDDTATPRVPHLRTEAWGGVLSAGAGVAARLTDRVAFIVDAHAFLVEVAPGAIVDAAPADGRPRAMVTTSLGVLAGF